MEFINETKIKSEKNKIITISEQKLDIRSLPNCIELLPNELLFMIMAHLSSSDLIKAFYGLNHRLDLIVLELARYFTISKETSNIEFDKYKSQIINVIEKICFDIELFPQVFQCSYSYSKLRSLVINCSNLITVNLNVDCNSVKSSIYSCLDVFRFCNIFSINWDNNIKCFNDDKYHLRFEENLQIEVMMNKLRCTSIVRLSICSCSEQTLVYLCAFAPNLIYLKVNQLLSMDDQLNLDSILDIIQQSSSLKQLHIASTSTRLNDIHLVGRLINCYESSLEYLTLEISLNNRIDGYYLERILEPCYYLKKFTFAFNYLDEEIEKINLLKQFQSDWWMDSHQSPVLIFSSNHSETLIVSMPSYLDDYIWFPIDPKDWLLNKGQLDSPDIRFIKQKCIRFVNSNRQSITLDIIHIIGHVFQAPKQELSIPHWKFVSPDILIDQLMMRKSIDPILPMVYSLNLNSCNLDQLDAKTLIIWLLLTSNVRVLNICQGSTSDKIQLANRLKTLIEQDKRLKSITDSIEEVQVFYMFDSLNYTTKQHICQMYSNIFRKPIICR